MVAAAKGLVSGQLKIWFRGGEVMDCRTDKDVCASSILLKLTGWLTMDRVY